MYDGDDVDEFKDKLGERIKAYDREIERMCNHHYQGFIDSVRELQQVSGDAASLKVRLINGNFLKAHYLNDLLVVNPLFFKPPFFCRHT